MFITIEKTQNDLNVKHSHGGQDVTVAYIGHSSFQPQHDN